MQKIFFLVVSILLFYSCGKEDLVLISCDSGMGLIRNADNTDCVCDTATFYAYGQYGQWSCFPKGEFTYKVKGFGRIVIPQILDKYLGSDSIGVMYFNGHSEVPGARLLFEPSSEGSTSFNVGLNSSITFNGDGSFEHYFEIKSIYCDESLDWSSRTNNVLARGNAHGKSNATNTEVDYTIYYTDYDGMPLDTGYLHLWK